MNHLEDEARGYCWAAIAGIAIPALLFLVSRLIAWTVSRRRPSAFWEGSMAGGGTNSYGPSRMKAIDRTINALLDAAFQGLQPTSDPRDLVSRYDRAVLEKKFREILRKPSRKHEPLDLRACKDI